MNTISVPTLTEREAGGWLALSPAGSPLNIAVVGDTAQEAEKNYAEALSEWDRLLALARARKEDE